jgi:Beta/Gamma crystallin
MAWLKMYSDKNYGGCEVCSDGDRPSLSAIGFNDILSSIKVESGTWTLFQHANYAGYSVTVSAHGGPNNDGEYPDSSWLGGRNDVFSSMRLNSTSG